MKVSDFFLYCYLAFVAEGHDIITKRNSKIYKMAQSNCKARPILTTDIDYEIWKKETDMEAIYFN